MLRQAHSMAQLNYPMPCCQNAWMEQQPCCYDPSHSSNMSLNMMPGGYPANPMWMGTWHGPPPGMYPYGLPPPHSRYLLRNIQHNSHNPDQSVHEWIMYSVQVLDLFSYQLITLENFPGF